MECSEKPIFHNYTGQELAQIRITAPEEAVRSLVKKHWDTLAKPLDGMGSFETITAQIGAILGTEDRPSEKRCADLLCRQRNRGGRREPDGAGGHVGGGKVHGTERILRLQDGAEHWRGDDPCGYRNK